jgi:hypothetical protein
MFMYPLVPNVTIACIVIMYMYIIDNTLAT